MSDGSTAAAEDGPIFVARGDELARLERLLDTALAGELSVCFVTGEAGSGKTSLLTEFARRAAEADPDLVFAIGDCNAQAGSGDPYLPFREILGMLTGDVDGKLAEGAITERNARRLTERIQTSARTVAEFGPALVDVFVPGSALAAQVGTLVARRLGWLKRDEDVVERAQPGTSVTWDRDQIFEQFTNVIRTLSEQQPLALLIDDLHWADSGSVDLLFHLCRRLGRSRVLLIGAYRPADVALGRSGSRHPLLQVTNEVKRYFGDVWIGLDEAGADEERAVVDAMIDREPNRLGAGFRDALLARTRGHPLFTNELLRALRERGDLVRDDEGQWIEGESIGWDAVPPRVEGVIGERIGRLPVELQDILEVAAVEGEDFTAESIARVLDLDRRDVTRLLSRSLDRDHQLVGARGVKRLDGRRLSLYRFRHNLFQAYLYDTLDEVERVQLHEEVGHALSELYAEDLDEIAAQLARHAELAGETMAAIGYLHRAGERARRSYANAEARDHFEAALRLLQEAPEAKLEAAGPPLGTAGPLEAELREGLGDVLAVTGQHELAQDAFRFAASLYAAGDALARARLARKVGDSLRGQNRWNDALESFAAAKTELGQEPLATDAAAWWREWIELRIGIIWARYFLGQAEEIARLAEEIGSPAEEYGTPIQRGSVFHCLILAAFRRERYETSDATLAMARQAVDFASGVGDLLTRVAAQFQLAFCHLWRDEFVDAERELHASLELAERAGWTWHRILSYTYLAVLHRRLGDITRTAEVTERSMDEATAADLHVYIGVAWGNRSWLAWRRGELEEAHRCGRKAVELWGAHGAYPFQWTALWPLAAVAARTDDLPAAIGCARTLIHTSQAKLPDPLTASLESAVGSWDANDQAAARVALERAVADAAESGYL